MAVLPHRPVEPQRDLDHTLGESTHGVLTVEPCTRILRMVLLRTKPDENLVHAAALGNLSNRLQGQARIPLLCGFHGRHKRDFTGALSMSVSLLARQIIVSVLCVFTVVSSSAAQSYLDEA